MSYRLSLKSGRYDRGKLQFNELKIILVFQMAELLLTTKFST